MAITLDEAVLISMVVESMFFGIYIVMFGCSLWVLVCRRPPPILYRLVFTAVLLFAVAVMHFSVDAYRVVAGFITYRDAPGGPVAYLNNLANSVYLFKSTLYVIQTLVGDSYMIYRCYVIWQKKIWIVAFPCLLVLACAATGIMVLVSFSGQGPTSEVFGFKEWISSFFTITLATNTISTVLIVYRIWSIDRAAEKSRQTASSLKPVMSAVIESGLIYSATLVCLIAAYFTGTWGHFILLDSLPPIIGIVFSMIIVRIGLSMSWGEESAGSLPSTRRDVRPPSAYMMQPKVVTVHVDRRTEVDDGSDSGFPASSVKAHYEVPTTW